MSQSYALDGARADLTADAEILALMAQDIHQLRSETSAPIRPQLVARGWSKQQVNNSFLRALVHAFDTYTATPVTPQDAFRIYAANEATPQEARQAAYFLAFDAAMHRRFAAIRRFFDPMMIWLTLCFATGGALVVRSLAGAAL